MRRSSLIPLLALLAVGGCGRQAKPTIAIVLGTTTSVQDTGLLDELLPRFLQQTGIEVRPVAVGSGQALQMARRGDADVLLTHAPEAEQRFVAEGHARERSLVMTNEFLLVGPPSDPAHVREAPSATEAFRRIAAARAPFVSRGDDSGTHQKERAIWEETGLTPAGDWYIEAGTGMAGTLRLAAEKQAYALTDQATYLALRRECGLVNLYRDDPTLLNQYSVIVVRPRPPRPDREAAAERFARFLLDPETQAEIGRFGVREFGEPLYVPTDSQPSSRGEPTADRSS